MGAVPEPDRDARAGRDERSAGLAREVGRGLLLLGLTGTSLGAVVRALTTATTWFGR